MRRWLPSLALVFMLASAQAAEPRTAVLEVTGMTCSLCPATVRKALERVPGVVEARVDLATRKAHAKYDPDKATPEALAKAATDAGFPSKVIGP